MTSLGSDGALDLPLQEVLTVSQISRIIQEVLEDRRLQDIWVRGEVTNFKCHSSGHCFFSLTEAARGKTYSLECVLWKSDAERLRCSPGNGMDVLVLGYMDYYAPQGRTRLYVRDMRHAGEGEKHLLVERWRRELALEGLFSQERKRPLPEFPIRVGVVTSPTGAVIEDIKNVIRRRFPVEIVLSPTAVQGDLAHLSLAAAIRRIDGRVHVIIIARGGGSFDDLFPFNHPDVVRAVAACTVPVVSAIGHEVDVTLCDLAADLRAPTPSAAAELVVKDRVALREDLAAMRRTLAVRIGERLERATAVIEDLRLHLHPRRLGRRLGDRRQETGDFLERLIHGMQGRLQRERLNIRALFATLEGKSPTAPLARGYCIAQKDKRTLRSIRDMAEGDRITLRMKDGVGSMLVEEVNDESNV